MKILGIITEYNPFHNGHLYHIQKSKEITGANYVVLVMSGNFTQTGNIALINKFKRANIACKYGVDLVIELPTIYAIASAEYFAKGAINLLNDLGIIDYICFGAEEENIQNLKDLSNILIENEKNIFEQIKVELKEGITFPKARQIAISNILANIDKSSYIDILSKPNNILGLEYLKALKTINSPIEAHLIKREGTHNHNDNNVSNQNTNTNNQTLFTSATSIRNMLKGDINIDLSNYIPEDMNNILKTSKLCFNDELFQILKYKILSTNIEDLKNIHEVTEGLENKIKTAIITSKNYDELVENLKTKRYTKTKIKRIVINIVLNISKDFFKQNNEENITYAHILAMSKNGKLLLSEISKKRKENLNIFTSINDKILNDKKIDSNVINLLKLDILATNIHSTLSGDDLNLDYTNKLK